VNSAVTQDRKFLAKTDLCDFDIRDEIRFLGPIQDSRQTGEYGIVVMGIVSELRNRLRDQDIEPVQTLGLVGVDVVVCLAQYRSRRQARRRA